MYQIVLQDYNKVATYLDVYWETLRSFKNMFTLHVYKGGLYS